MRHHRVATSMVVVGENLRLSFFPEKWTVVSTSGQR